ncbi:MAG TPA: hypothetical protein VLM85_26650 [Polyangiaceae bacterium]|nr:hypothetical protein [Polyangiaceae bacterium]
MIRRAVAAFTLAIAAASPLACGPGAEAPKRPPLAEKWLARAEASYKAGDFEDAKTSVEEGLRVAPHDAELRTLGGRLALARLDFSAALGMTDGLSTTDAHGIRGRAQWYAGNLDNAADELEAMLTDPSVKDPWARDVARLARKGNGRHPFAMEGGVVALVQMPEAGPALIVPCELEGEQVLTMIATGAPEVIIDSTARSEPTWVSLRFGDRIDVRDVPALTQDLSGISRVLGAPIKALLGVNLLRHIHATFDRRGGQFVVRLADPPSPPTASRLPTYYARGGAMLVRMQIAPREDGSSLFYVDSSQPYTLAMQDSLWKKAGVDVSQMVPSTILPNSRAGTIPSLRLGGMDFPSVPGLALSSVSEQAPNMDIDLGGVVGAELLEAFRVTFTDAGRAIWVEPDPTMMTDNRGPARPPLVGPDPLPPVGTEGAKKP